MASIANCLFARGYICSGPVIQEIFDLENLILHGAAADGPLSQLL